MTNVSDEMRNALMEGAAWDRLGLRPTFLTEDDEKEVEEVEEGAEDESSEDETAEVVEESYTNAELLHALLEEMSDEELLEHIGSVLEVVDAAGEVLEEEEENSFSDDEDN